MSKQEEVGAIDPQLFERLNLDKYIPYIKKYEQLKSEITKVDIRTGPQYQREFLNLHEEFAKLYASIEMAYKNSVAETESIFSIAVFERAVQYFAKHDVLKGGIKDSVALREKYAVTDSEYLESLKIQHELLALRIFLKQKLENCRLSFQAVRGIYDKCTSGPFGRTGFFPAKSG